MKIPTRGTGPLKKKIQRLFISDCTAIVTAMIALWAMIMFAMTSVRAIAPTRVVATFIFASALLICIFGTVSLAAVLIHLKRNRDAIYTEDILASTGQE